MTTLPEPKPTAAAAGQAASPLTDAVIRAAVENAIHESRRESTAPLPVQPGRPPMSQRAVDASTVMLSASVATIPPGAVAVGVLLASGYADPAVIGMLCAAPAALAVPVLAIAKLVRSAKSVLPEEHHHHYEGPVFQDQRNVESHSRGVWVRNTNQS